MAPIFTGSKFGFGRSAAAAVALSEFIQYYIFNSPGSLNTTTANNFGFAFSPSALVSLLTIGNGSSGSFGTTGPNNNGGNGGPSGTVVVRIDVPLGTVAPGGSLPYTLGTISGGVSIGSISGGAGAPTGSTPGITGNPGLFPGLSPYTPNFALYTITAGSGGAGGATYNYVGPYGGGGGGGAGGLVLSNATPNTPLIFGPTASPAPTATSGTPGGSTGPGNNNGTPPRAGGGGGTGGTGYGAGGGGGGGPVENWGATSPTGPGGAGAAGIFIIKISEFR